LNNFNLKCDIYFDSTVLYTDIVLFTKEWVEINIYLLVKYDINKIFYDIWIFNKLKPNEKHIIEFNDL
jgi:hypothetical protein